MSTLGSNPQEQWRMSGCSFCDAAALTPLKEGLKGLPRK